MKRILALILSAVLMLSISVPAYATGDENIDGGGGNMGSGTSTSYWNPGMDGVRVSVINVDSHAVPTKHPHRALFILAKSASCPITPDGVSLR